ncbi:MAG: hypothetical protein SGILL_003465 [Bacillariaceae sp.]
MGNHRGGPPMAPPFRPPPPPPVRLPPPPAPMMQQHHQQQQQQHQQLPPMASSYAHGALPGAHPSPVVTGTSLSNQRSPAIPGTAPPMTGSYTAQQIDQAWKEYSAPSGVKYYHNALLGTSSYAKPAFMIRRDAVSAAVTPHSPSSSQNKRTWQEYDDATSGKKYYSDGVTTTWEKPKGYISPDTIVAQTSLSTKEEHAEPSKKKKRLSDGAAKKELVAFGSKSEAIAAFKGLLLAKDVSPSHKWNEVVKACESDSRWAARWEACADVLSVGERRQALAEYQTKRANEIRDEERKERARAKENFGQMLTELLPKIPGFSAHSSRFADVRPTLEQDGRFFAIEKGGERESLFLDFVDDSKKREERNKRSKKKVAQDSFIEFLKEKREGGLLTDASTWQSFLASLSETEKADSRFCTSVLVPDSDRQLYFADFALELQNAEDDKRRRIRDARRRAEKAQRDNFRQLLREKAAGGRIFPYSRWRMVVEMLAQDESFALVEAQGRDMPRQLFEEFADEWDDIFRRERSFLIRLLDRRSDNEEVIKRETTYESFKKLLMEVASYSEEAERDAYRIISREDPVSSARLYYDELMSLLSRQQKPDEESSEDEGEIIEDGEVSEDDNAATKDTKTANETSLPTAVTTTTEPADTGLETQHGENDQSLEAKGLDGADENEVSNSA